MTDKMNNLKQLNAMREAGDKATQGELFYDDEEPTISSENGIAWDFEDGWGSDEDREFFIQAANSRKALSETLDKLVPIEGLGEARINAFDEVDDGGNEVIVFGSAKEREAYHQAAKNWHELTGE